MSRTQVLYFLVVFLIVAGSLIAPVGGIISPLVQGETQQAITDTNGPVFDVPFGNLSIDLPPETGPMNISLKLRVEVTDPDGVDTVIGSYRLDEETEWHNKTHSYTPRETHPNLYSAFVMNYTLGPGNWGVRWYFKFYANDTVGSWNSSAVYVHSIWGGGMSSPTQCIFLNPLFWIAVIATVFVVAVVVRRFLKNRTFGQDSSKSPALEDTMHAEHEAPLLP